MRNLKTISLFKIVVIVCLNLFILNPVLLLLSIAYLLFDNKYSLIIFVFGFIFAYISNTTLTDFIKYGIVIDSSDNYVIVDKFLYRIKAYNSKYEIGDIVYNYERFTHSDNKYNLSHNIRFQDNKSLIKKGELSIRKVVSNRIESFSDESTNYLRKILFNDNSNDDEIKYIGYGFSFYYLLLAIKRRSRSLSMIIFIIYIILFGFDLKLYLILIDYILDLLKIDRIDRLAIKLYLIVLINKYLIYNYSIILTLLISLYYMSEFSSDKSIFAIGQSLFFNEIQIISTFFYPQLIKMRVMIFIISFILFLFSGFEQLYLNIISVFSKIYDVLSISIRGKLTFVSIILLFTIYKLLKIHNNYFKILLLFCFLIFPINNPLKHVSFIDVGQGDSSLIKGELNRYNILIDTGSNYNYSKLRRFLFKEGIYKLDYLIITHDDVDHSGNINNLKKDFIIENTINIGQDISLNNDNLKYLDLGNSNNDNDNSLVYLLTIDNHKVLYTGDVSKRIENSIVNKYNVDDIYILKVSHHGSVSATSSYFVGNLLPRYAIISTSGAYSHPSKEVINTLNSYSVRTFITKSSGNISFYFTKLIDFLKTGDNKWVIIKP